MSHLLLLPAPPSSDLAVLEELYTPAILAALHRTASADFSTLDIAIHTPYLTSEPSRRKSFHRAQQLLARLYTLSHNLCVKSQRIDIVDIRILFLTSYRETGEKEWPFGPVISSRRLAKSGRNWDCITIAEIISSEKENVSSPEHSEEPLSAFLAHLGSTNSSIQRLYLPFTPSPTKSPQPVLPLDPSFTEHSLVIVGGTFDHLHPGHKHLLTMTLFLLSPPHPHLIIGLSGPQLLASKKHSTLLAPWSSRAESVFTFLSSILLFSPSPFLTPAAATTPKTEKTPENVTRKFEGDGEELVVEVVEINDPFGPTTTNEAITALIVSEETRAGGEAVNKMRAEKGWRALECWVVDVVEGGEEGKLSSTEIRMRLEAKGSSEEKL